MKTIVLCAALAALYCAPAGAAGIEGAAAPAFCLADGNGMRLDSASLKGKTVIGFYNDRDASEKNDELARELDAMIGEVLHGRNVEVYRFAATDASPANFFTRPVWRRVLAAKSKTLGMTLWGDWDASMKKSYGLPDNESTFIVIDRRGMLRCLRSGKLQKSEFIEIRKILAAAFAEQ